MPIPGLARIVFIGVVTGCVVTDAWAEIPLVPPPPPPPLLESEEIPEDAAAEITPLFFKSRYSTKAPAATSSQIQAFFKLNPLCNGFRLYDKAG